MRLHWHRRDLRLSDNRGLADADDASPILPVFVIDEGIHDHASPPRIAFVRDALTALRVDYRARGSDLVVRRGDPTTILPDLAARLDAEAVTAGTDYSGLAKRRDRAVGDALADAGAHFETAHDAVLVPPGTITTADGDPYSVFSYYADKWHDRPVADPVAMPPSPDLVAPRDCGVDPGEIPTLAALDVGEPEAATPPTGTEAARERLGRFVEGPIYEYAQQRDYPAAGTTSRLSPHLRFGTIGIREVYEATAAAAASAPDGDARDSVREFQEQLAWRDFYTEQLAHHPTMVAENLDPFPGAIEWVNDEDDFAAWTEGRTGYPIVDAGMRQLRREAWMHNRVRMLVASFLTKDLRIDWRWGYAWFREKLVDHDPANDAGGWQWAASTGTDAQPFFRIFNPTSQVAEYDPDGEYVREYVPELRDASTDAIHDWPDLSPEERRGAAPDYPAPIVDHGEAREAALAMFRRARGE